MANPPKLGKAVGGFKKDWELVEWFKTSDFGSDMDKISSSKVRILHSQQTLTFSSRKHF